MKVSLITHTPDPEKTVASAAKLCYSDADVATLMNGLTDEKITAFVNSLMNIGHESPLEHVTFTFAIEGISRACSHQLVRHRIASYSQKSQRYVSENQFEYITPPTITNTPEALEEFTKCMTTITESYDKLADILTNKYICDSVGDISNVPNDVKRKASKQAYEDARFVLPNACETKIIVTMNVRSLLNFFKHRCCHRAQWEIREVAYEMLTICKQVAPNLFRHAGPSCYSKKCTEGKMSCGKSQEVIDRINNIK